MVEGVSPVTRLSSADELFGCWMLTVEPWPMEKLCQLTTALWLVWVMFRLRGGGLSDRDAAGCDAAAGRQVLRLRGADEKRTA